MGEAQEARPIRIYTLGRFSLVRNGEPIRFSAKTKKPIELLKTLLAAGGRDVCTGQLSDILWPHSEADAAHNVLSVTLHRLRNMLGDHDAIHIRDNKLTLNPLTCWVDAWELERRLNKLETLLKSQQPCAQTIRSGAAALLDLCKGSFLKGDTCRTIIAARERLHNRILRALDTIGQYWEQSGDWAHAREFYQKGLELEPMLESLYQRLMICHREMGQRAEAIMAYRRCQDALSSHLNVPPSRHTEAIRKTLIAD